MNPLQQSLKSILLKQFQNPLKKKQLFVTIFPGQGSQHVSMLKDFSSHPIVNETLEEASSCLNFDLKKLMFEGPEEMLTLTKNTQPAILTHSYAIWRMLSIDPIFTLGHSLGEYSSLVCSKSLDFSSCLKMVRERGELMMNAVASNTESTFMTALLPITLENAEELCKVVFERTGECCEVSNHNTQNQIVVSGTPNSMSAVSELAKKFGVKRAMKLKTSQPFHCSLMKNAGDGFENALNTYLKLNEEDFSKAPFFISNVTAREVLDSREMKPLLKKQIYSRVRWFESVQYVCNAIEEAVGDENVQVSWLEIGPNNHLTGMMHRIIEEGGLNSGGVKHQVFNLGTREKVEEFLKVTR